MSKKVAVIAVNPVNGYGLFHYLEALYENKIAYRVYAIDETVDIKTNSGIALKADDVKKIIEMNRNQEYPEQLEDYVVELMSTAALEQESSAADFEREIQLLADEGGEGASTSGARRADMSGRKEDVRGGASSSGARRAEMSVKREEGRGSANSSGARRGDMSGRKDDVRGKRDEVRSKMEEGKGEREERKSSRGHGRGGGNRNNRQSRPPRENNK